MKRKVFIVTVVVFLLVCNILLLVNFSVSSKKINYMNRENDLVLLHSIGSIAQMLDDINQTPENRQIILRNISINIGKFTNSAQFTNSNNKYTLIKLSQSFEKNFGSQIIEQYTKNEDFHKISLLMKDLEQNYNDTILTEKIINLLDQM